MGHIVEYNHVAFTVKEFKSTNSRFPYTPPRTHFLIVLNSHARLFGTYDYVLALLTLTIHWTQKIPKHLPYETLKLSRCARFISRS